MPASGGGCTEEDAHGMACEQPVYTRKRRRRASPGRKFKQSLLRIGQSLADWGLVAVVSVAMAGKWLWHWVVVLLEQIQEWCGQRTDAQQDKKNQQRYYCYTPEASGKDGSSEDPQVQDVSAKHQKQGRFRIACIGALLCMLLWSAFELGTYTVEYLSSKHVSEELRKEYYLALSEETAAPTLPPATHTPIPTPTATLQPQTTAAPTETPRTTLPEIEYPQNPYKIISSRFQGLRRQNKDIVGWLTIPDLLDEAVVQRDNSYYLRRDYRGYHNDNGAVFLEESCNLSTRPYTMLLFGHNMKSGAMFGCLRNYEKVYFYRNNPFITFDTLYENGRYVIFAVGTLSQRPSDLKYMDMGGLVYANIQRRQTAIAQLKRISVFTTSIDVAVDDQLLLLITCVDDDTERRFVAARRLRDGETEAQLQQQVDKTYAR